MRWLHELTFALRILTVILIALCLMPAVWLADWLSPQHSEVNQ